MSVSFPGTLRSLASSSARRRRATLAVGVLVLLAWSVWAVAARLSIVVVSHRGRLETRHAVQRIAAPIAGRVIRAKLSLGDAVRRGEVLLELDAGEESILRARFESDVANLSRRIATMNEQNDAMRELVAAQAYSFESKLQQARESTEQARHLAAIHRAQASRSVALARDGLVSQPAADDDIRRAQAEEARVRSLTAVEEEVRKLALEATASSKAKLRELETNRIDLEQQLAVARSSLRATELAIERLCVRAPLDGRISSSSEPRPGAWMAAGETLCSIVPSDPLEVSAWFPLESMPLVRSGQPATVWLNGLTANARTILRARVLAIEQDPAGTEFRVRLRLDAAALPRNVADQGFPVVAVVEVQRLSPLQALLRAAGMVRGT